MIITQDEYNVVKQTNRYLHMKINLLNYKFQIVDELSGTLVGDPTFTINSDSDMRRTCAFSLVPTDSSFDIKNGNKVWMDKYVQIYIGIENSRTDDITYSNQGIYMVHNPNSIYSATNNTITIQGIDLMAKLTGLRNGNLEGLPYLIEQGSSVREAVIACLKEAGFDRYVVEEYEITTPYEIKVDVGGTVYNILTELRDILPNYQMYFDVDGIFHFEQIPSGNNEQIFIDDDIWSRVLIDYSKSIDFTTVKNYIEVFGKTHDITNFGNTAEIEENIYKITIEGLLNLRDYVKIGFITTEPLLNPMLKVNEYNAYPILNEDGTVPELAEGEQYYVVKFKEYEDSTDEELKGYFEFMGNVQPYAIAKEENPDSPFYINGRLGIIRIVLSGGEYDNIYTDALAQERANWELYTRCKLQDSITLNCLPIYWIEVNKVISITLPNKQGDEETNLYIIKSVNTTYGVTGVQSIQCMRYYPYYSNYIRNLKGE